jgi:hypothetical protein
MSIGDYLISLESKHIPIGLGIGLVAGFVSQNSAFHFEAFLVASAFAILPDLDLLVNYVSRFTNSFALVHRTWITHSLLPVLALLLSPFSSLWLYALIGISAHLLADAVQSAWITPGEPALSGSALPIHPYVGNRFSGGVITAIVGWAIPVYYLLPLIQGVI